MSADETAAAPPFGVRRGLLFEAVTAAGADAILVTAPANVRYLSGFTGTNGWLLVGQARPLFFTDPRYGEQARREITDAEVVVTASGLVEALSGRLSELGQAQVAFEAEHVTVALRDKLEEGSGVDWTGLGGVIEEARQKKDAGEIEAIRRALEIAEVALGEVAPGIAAGQSEKQVAADLERACRSGGAEGMAFETIVASGPRTALPHGVASDREIGAGEPVMIDMGCRIDGYCSDITRMVWCGDEPDPDWARLVEVVLSAQVAAMEAVRSGVAASEVDAAARGVIDEAGYGTGFVHGTGHGVGLEVHEAPALSKRGESCLEAGMVVTIEPAIYLEGRVGVRIEEMVCVTDAGCTRLTALDPEPILARAP